MDEPNAHPWIWVVYALLFGAAAPWYLPHELASRTWLGFPAWVTISLFATLGIALFTTFVIGAYWTDDVDEADEQ